MPDRPRLVLRPGKDKALRRGYPWVFANQLDPRSDRPSRGAVVELATAEGERLGLAFAHDTSQIAARFLTTDLDAEIGPAFFRQRLERALALRRAAFPETTHARIVFGESDGLPGLVVDRYGPPGYRGGILTYTCLSYGTEQHREAILDALEELLTPQAILERNDAPLREKDALPMATGVLRGRHPGPVELEEEGAYFRVDPLTGPKTGFFIDQRLHRLALRPFARGRRVLDVFCADGGFGIGTAVGGAEHVTLLDVSAAAVERARTNAERSGVADRCTFEIGDALEVLPERLRQGGYDVIVLDPPSFASSRRHLEAAQKAYQRLNITALRALPPGGLLATASCSQALDEEAFLKILRYSALRANAPFRVVYRGTQPPDHPVLDAMPETHYLSFYLLQKLADEVPG